MNRRIPAALSLAVSALLFGTPAILVLVVGLLGTEPDQSFDLDLPRNARLVAALLGAAALVAPIVYRRGKRPSRDNSRGADFSGFVLRLVLALVPAYLGFLLALQNLSLAEVQLGALASSAAILYWSWCYRHLYYGELLPSRSRGFTVPLRITGLFFLIYAAFQCATWWSLPAGTTDTVITGYISFVYGSLGLGALLTAHLRAMHSPASRAATVVVSIIAAPVLPFGTFLFVLWLLWGRRRDREKPVAQAA